MQRRQLGNTGFEVSVLGLGAANLGGVYGPVDEGTAIATVHRAFDLGVNLFDAAPYYGDTRAETVLGKALRGLPRQDFVLATKAGRYGPDRFDFSPARIRRSLDESLQRLGTGYVDVFQLHDVEFGDLDRILDESVAELHALRDRGKVRAIGITGMPLAIFRRALQRGTQLDVALSYCHATLFDQTLLDLLPALAQAGVGVLNASPAAMGLLSSHGPQPWHPAGPGLRACCAAAAAHCRRRDVELATLAVQFSTALPGIAATLCGTASPAEIEANVAAVAAPPDHGLLAEVLAILTPIRNQTWPQGRPENQ